MTALNKIAIDLLNSVIAFALPVDLTDVSKTPLALLQSVIDGEMIDAVNVLIFEETGENDPDYGALETKITQFLAVVEHRAVLVDSDYGVVARAATNSEVGLASDGSQLMVPGYGRCVVITACDL